MEFEKPTPLKWDVSMWSRPESPASLPRPWQLVLRTLTTKARTDSQDHIQQEGTQGGQQYLLMVNIVVFFPEDL